MKSYAMRKPYLERRKMTKRIVISGLCSGVSIVLLSAFVWIPNAFGDEIERDTEGRIVRSSHTLVEFQHANPCPVTLKKVGACHGYVKDHIIPLCAGGHDSVGNLKWSEQVYSVFRDKQEWELCRQLKRLGKVTLDMPKNTLCSVINGQNLRLLKNDICK
jgi:hypothetical protein